MTVAILHKPDNKSDIMGDDAAKFDLRLFFREPGKRGRAHIHTEALHFRADSCFSRAASKMIN